MTSTTKYDRLIPFLTEKVIAMDSSGMLANRRRELNDRKAKLEHEVSALRKKVAEIDLELGAIAAYDEHMARRTDALDVQVGARLHPGEVTREKVLALVRGKADGLSRREIIEALAVKGDKSGEIAVDNRLRELKRKGSVLHEGRRYRAGS